MSLERVASVVIGAITRLIGYFGKCFDGSIQPLNSVGKLWGDWALRGGAQNQPLGKGNGKWLSCLLDQSGDLIEWISTGH